MNFNKLPDRFKKLIGEYEIGAKEWDLLKKIGAFDETAFNPKGSKKVKYITEQERIRPKKSEVERLWCDNKKIFSLTGFKPEVSIVEGLQRTIDWIIQPENLQAYKTDIYNI